MSAMQQLAPHVGQAAACRALGMPRASWYRRLQPIASLARISHQKNRKGCRFVA